MENFDRLHAQKEAMLKREQLRGYIAEAERIIAEQPKSGVVPDLRDAIELWELALRGVENSTQKNGALWTHRKYPCGCEAQGEGNIPPYCPEHEKPQPHA